MIAIISTNDIKKRNLWIDSDIDADLIEWATVLTQRTLCKNTLGYEYWEKLYNVYISSGTSGYTTDDFYILDNYLYDIISYGVANELVENLYNQLKSDGIRNMTSSQSIISPDKLISMEHQRWQGKIDDRRTEMIEHMSRNRSKYPLYFGSFCKKTVTTFPIHRIKKNLRYR